MDNVELNKVESEDTAPMKFTDSIQVSPEFIKYFKACIAAFERTHGIGEAKKAIDNFSGKNFKNKKSLKNK